MKILDAVRLLSNFLSREFRLSGVNGIDFILRDDQVYLTEVNPRYSASMELMEIAYGLPIFHIHLRSVLNSELPAFDLELQEHRNLFHGKSYLYAEKNVTMPCTEEWTERGIRDVPRSGERIRTGGPICTVGSIGATRESALAAMTDQMEKLKEEIYG
jgi:predicted ATP-grasp superfamily ATP-dependent carboligase